MAIVVVELSEGEIQGVHCESPDGCTVFTVDWDHGDTLIEGNMGTISKFPTQHKSRKFVTEVLDIYMEQKRAKAKQENGS